MNVIYMERVSPQLSDIAMGDLWNDLMKGYVKRNFETECQNGRM